MPSAVAKGVIVDGAFQTEESNISPLEYSEVPSGFVVAEKTLNGDTTNSAVAVSVPDGVTIKSSDAPQGWTSVSIDSESAVFMSQTALSEINVEFILRCENESGEEVDYHVYLEFTQA